MVRIIGAGCIFLGCGSFGFAMAAAHRREEAELCRYLGALEYMSCELSYRLTPLNALCRGAAENSSGTVRQFLTEVAAALERQTSADAQACVCEVLVHLEVTPRLRKLFRELGATLGRFDLSGQLRGLESAIRSGEEALRTLREGAADRRRSWQTLGLCAGAALAILFL